MASRGSGGSRDRARARGPPIEGTGRMDAAVDAMKQMGFERDVIIQTVKGLLQVYGRDGWMFIEEHSYSVLIETLLERQGSTDQENVEQERFQRAGHPMSQAVRDQLGDSQTTPSLTRLIGQCAWKCFLRCFLDSYLMEDAKITPPQAGARMTLAARESSVIHSPPSSNRQAVDARLQLPKQSSMSNEAETLAAGKSSVIHSPPSSIMHDLDAAFEAKQILSPSSPENESLESASHKNKPGSKPEGRGETPRKRKPCYGWISDGDDDDEFVELTPAYPIARRK